MTPPPLNPKLMLVNAHMLFFKKYKSAPLWAFVCDITGHGSTRSAAICREFGWNPHQPCSIPIFYETTTTRV